MRLLEAAVLGVVQGLTEFLPISSSAHLDIIHRLLHWRTDALVFDVGLHFGTAVALLIYFRTDWFLILRNAFAPSRRPASLPDAPGAATTPSVPSLWAIVVACIPAGIAGVLLEDHAESVFRDPPLMAAAVIGLGVLLFAADRLGRRTRNAEAASMLDWILLGLAQTLAIVPGVSRSGITITAGLFRSFDRPSAARLSFLLGTPIILGAAAYEGRYLTSMPSSDLVTLAVGIVTSALAGYAAIGFLLRFLEKRGVLLFVAYRMLFGIAVLAMFRSGWLG